MIPKKDSAYLDYIRSLPCANPACDQSTPTQAHHPRGHIYGTGTSLKAPDVLAMPLCEKCHTGYHTARHANPAILQMEIFVRTIVRALNDGELVRPDDRMEEIRDWWNASLVGVGEDLDIASTQDDLKRIDGLLNR